MLPQGSADAKPAEFWQDASAYSQLFRMAMKGYAAGGSRLFALMSFARTRPVLTVAALLWTTAPAWVEPVASIANTPDAERLLLKGRDAEPSPYRVDIHAGVGRAVAQGQRRGLAGSFPQRHHRARQPA